jgi:type IV secretory pathway VirB10-like protein
MRTRGVRAGIAVTALAAAVVLFVVLAGADDPATNPATTQLESAQTTTGGQSPTAPTTTQPKPAQETTTAGEPPDPEPPPIPRIVVRDGQPVGGVARLEYESGQRVRFTVRSDSADEVHVHGFDIKKDVPANGSVRFEFRADVEGVFEVELETTHVQIAELRIEP